MAREDILREARDILAKVGFFVSESHAIRSISFDLVARRDDLLVFCKVLSNIDSFGKDNARELKTLAGHLGGYPMVLGHRSGAGELGDGIVYYRHGIPIISMGTLRDFFSEGVPPFIYAAPGGLYVHLDGDALRELRHERRLSLGTLAEIAGVSRRTIQMYEDGMGAIVDVAVRLEEYLDEPLVLPVDPFKYVTDKKDDTAPVEELEGVEGLPRDVFTHLDELGYSIFPTSKCPFDALSQESTTMLLTGVGRYGKALVKRARMVSNISAVVEKPSVIFTEKKGEKNLEGTPIISKVELALMDDPKAVIELIMERR